MSKSQVFVSYSVPKGYAVIVARAIIPIWTCVERITGVPIDYGHLNFLTVKYRVTLEMIIIRIITLSTANAIRKEYGNHTPIIL